MADGIMLEDGELTLEKLQGMWERLPASYLHTPVPSILEEEAYAMLKARSNKQRRLIRERTPIALAVLYEHPWCQRCREARSTQVHEPLTRARGGSITDPANMKALCFACHDWIHGHPAEALAQGWLRKR